MSLKYILFVAVILFTFQSKPVYSQNINPASVNVQELDDQQIDRIILEIEKRGLSLQQAIGLAKAQGATQMQINQLTARIQEKNLRSGTQNMANPNVPQNFMEEEDTTYLGQKEEIIPTEKERQIFGFSFFNQKNLSFEPSVNMPLPEDYILGIGDQIMISVWGASQASYPVQVSSNGTINIPDVGPVQVSGKTLKLVKGTITSRLTGIYNGMTGAEPNTWAEVSFVSGRSIKINVIGEAFTPGTYTLPATSTAFNALYLSGGPNKNGSFRKIKIIRNGKKEQILDVYDFLINANAKVNIQLQDQDIVYIPTFENRVEISGEFKRTGYFELLEQETMADAIQMAGGFAENAYQNSLYLTRKTKKEKKLHDIPNDLFESFTLKNGDEVYAGSILDRYENRVSITGAVFRPGAYALTEGMTLSQLIQKAEGLKEEAFMQRGTITRRMDNYQLESIPFNIRDVLNGTSDLALQAEDLLTIRSVFDMQEEQIINVYGEVQEPGEYIFFKNLTLSDVIFNAGGFKESADIAFVEIARRLNYEEIGKTGNKLSHIHQFSISRNLELSRTDAEFKIFPFDQIYIRRAPGFRKPGTVRINGEVLYAGSYSISDKNEKLTDLIKRAGGLTPEAWVQGASLTRTISLSEEEWQAKQRLEKMDSLAVDEIEKVEQVVIGIELTEVLQNPESNENLILQAGDVLFIPQQLQTVRVSGNVMSAVALTFVEGKKVKHYVQYSGGFAQRSKKTKVYVRYPNGITASTHSFLGFKKYPDIMPGCEIIVPAKPEKAGWGAGQWVALGSGLASLAVSIATVANLTKK